MSGGISSCVTFGFKLTLLMLLVTYGSPTCASPAEPPLVVRLYNYAEAPEPVLGIMKSEAEAVFREAQIGVVWLDCTPRRRGSQEVACDEPMGPGDLVLNLLNRFRPATWLSEKALGFALLSGKNEAATTAYLSYEQARALVRRDDTALGRLLGLAAAHEISHLLLHHNRHGRKGLMRSPWQVDSTNLTQRGSYRIAPDEAEELRRALALRTESRAKNAETQLTHQGRSQATNRLGPQNIR